MRYPSIKTLSAVFGDKAKQAREILEMTRGQLVAGPAAARRKECYHSPSTMDLRMHALNALGETYGLEHAEGNHGVVSFLNSGDTYNPTIIYWHGTYRVQSFGDFVETMERQSINFR